ncbi:MAG: hypothetical protein KDK23_11190 [Leptospiraceae bacterium]|nr:hypothetical protein [Leptospiraceae bacterium]
MQFAFYIPVAAVFSGIGVLAHLLSLKRREPWQSSLVLLYGSLLASNLCIAIMISRQTAEEAEFVLFLLRHFFFSLPGLFLNFALNFASVSRRWLWPALVCTIALITVADLDYFFQLRWLLDRMERHSWGFFPRGTSLAIGALAILATYCISLAFWTLLRSRRIADNSVRSIVFLFVLWWIGIVLSMLPFAGVDIFPPGPAMDAAISAVIGALLSRNQKGGRISRALAGFSGLFASVALGTLAGWIVLVLSSGQMLPVLIAVSITSLAALTGWNRISRKSSDFRPVFVVLQSDYDLTYQEARICELVLEGMGRPRIETALGIGGGTLRNHLTSIYGKTIDIEEPESELSRDKLQRLTVFLSRLEQTGREEGSAPE